MTDLVLLPYDLQFICSGHCREIKVVLTNQGTEKNPPVQVVH